MSAPHITPSHSLFPTAILSTPDSSNTQLPLLANLDSLNRDPDVSTIHPSDVDPQILEALRSKDRLYVLKLGEIMEGLINERR
jgi:hypothetical protein